MTNDWRQPNTVGVTQLALTREQFNFLLETIRGSAANIRAGNAAADAVTRLRSALFDGLSDCDRSDQKRERVRQERAELVSKYEARKARA